MPAPALIHELVERFDRNRDAYRSGQYNETQARREFIDPVLRGARLGREQSPGLCRGV